MSRNNTVEYIRYITDLYSLYSGLFNIIVGLFGHTCLIIVLTKIKVFRGNQCSFYLTIESISNIGLLISIYSIMIKYILNFNPIISSFAGCKIRTTLAQTFGLCSAYTICSMTIDQFLTTHYRYSYRQKSSLKIAHRIIFIIISLCTSHSLIYLVFAEANIQLNVCTVYHPIARKYLSYFYYPVISNGLPTILTITMSILAYRNVRRIIRRQIPIVRRRLDRQLTAMILARVLCAIILSIPFLCSTIFELNIRINEQNSILISIVTSISAITYSLLYTNFSISFYIFLLVSSRFRHQVKNFIFKQLFHCCINITNNNQIVPRISYQNDLIVEPVE